MTKGNQRQRQFGLPMPGIEPDRADYKANSHLPRALRRVCQNPPCTELTKPLLRFDSYSKNIVVLSKTVSND